MADKINKVVTIPKGVRGMAKDSAGNLRTRAGAPNPFVTNQTKGQPQVTAQKPPAAPSTKKD